MWSRHFQQEDERKTRVETLRNETAKLALSVAGRCSVQGIAPDCELVEMTQRWVQRWPKRRSGQEVANRRAALLWYLGPDTDGRTAWLAPDGVVWVGTVLQQSKGLKRLTYPAGGYICNSDSQVILPGEASDALTMDQVERARTHVESAARRWFQGDR